MSDGSAEFGGSGGVSGDAGGDALLADLTAEQREAVLHTEGPVLILAAAGSGKTRTLTRRIGHLLRIGIPPWSILALTFTNKAAGEMRQRVESLLGGGGIGAGVGGGAGIGGGGGASRGLTVTTFHSLCARLLRRYAEVAEREGVLPGLRAEYSIYDTSDQMALLKKVLEGLGLSSTNWPPRSVLSAISSAKNELLDAGAFSARASDFYTRTIARAYEGYERGLRAAGAVDFDDLLLMTARLLERSATVREECQRRWQYLLIDEYQDTNRAQFVIASLLAGKGSGQRGPNVCVVGDPDQSIYGWRGADISNILDFEEQYPGCRVITLGENFRSTAAILAVADTLIKRNVRRKDKPLFTRRAGGDRVEAVLCRDEHHEASLVVDWLRSRREKGVAWREMAVFYRTNALSRVVEDALRSSAVPYTIARGTAFYEREEVRTALAYLRVVANASDDVSLSRVLNTPARGIGDTTRATLESLAARRGVGLLSALRLVAGGEAVEGLPARASGAVGRFVELIDGWTGHGSFWAGRDDGGMTLAGLVERVIKESGLERMYEAQARTSGSETDAERLDNLGELISSAREFELEFDPAGDAGSDVEEVRAGRAAAPPLLAMLRAYLESVALVADADAVDPDQGAVTLMTLHAAKGLEFDSAVMIGLDEGLLPHGRARESEADLEEERRLAFVGITRAMRRLMLTSAKYRTVRGASERQIPSRFLDELGREHVQFSDRSDPMGEGGGSWTGEEDERDREMALRRGVPPSLLEGVRRGGGGGSGGGGGVGGAAGARFPVGSMVRHPQFGVGKVVGVQGGPSARVRIAFREVGEKTLVLEYARLERVAGG